MFIHIILKCNSQVIEVMCVHVSSTYQCISKLLLVISAIHSVGSTLIEVPVVVHVSYTKTLCGEHEGSRREGGKEGGKVGERGNGLWRGRKEGGREGGSEGDVMRKVKKSDRERRSGMGVRKRSKRMG